MDDFIRKRLLDLAAQADRSSRYTFTDFLNEADFSEFTAIRGQLPPCGYTVSGGHENADRVMIRFGSEAQLGYDEPFPIVCIHIEPVVEKFAENLTHRDYLGALMHLGMERTELGDILVSEKQAYLFCRGTMAEYICRNLDRIRHTSVRCTVTDAPPELAAAKIERVSIQAASVRIDGVIAKLLHISRGDCIELFRAGRVFLDGALLENNSHMLKEGEKVSVRGFGKFQFAGESGTTRKGNLILNIDRFV